MAEKFSYRLLRSKIHHCDFLYRPHNLKKLALFLLFVLIFFLLAVSRLSQPPRPGEIYRLRTDTSVLSDRTGLVRRLGECIVISFDERDIERVDLPSSSRDHVYLIALGGHVSAEMRQGDVVLKDSKSGLVAGVGDAIDGELFARRSEGWFDALVRVGWFANRSCGLPFAEVRSIRRVH